MRDIIARRVKAFTPFRKEKKGGEEERRRKGRTERGKRDDKRGEEREEARGESRVEDGRKKGLLRWKDGKGGRILSAGVGD